MPSHPAEHSRGPRWREELALEVVEALAASLDREEALRRILNAVTDSLEPEDRGFLERLRASLEGALQQRRSEALREAEETSRQRAEQTRRESEERYRELVEMLPLPVFETDATGRLTYVNRIAFETFGYGQEELDAGATAIQMIAPQDRPRALESMARVLKGEKTVGSGYLGLRQSGEVFPITIYSSPITRDGSVIGLRGTIIDSSQARRAEEERGRLQAQLFHAQKLESIGTLAGGIAHDFNNLLGGVLGNLSLIEEEIGEDATVKEDLLEMKALVMRGADLTRQLLGFARRGTLIPRPLDLNLVVEKTTRMFGRTRKDLVLRLEREPQLPTVMADRTQLEQVLLNLLLNAGQAMPDGGELRVRTETVELSPEDAALHGVALGRAVRLEVEDRGVGMDVETQARIFEPFFTTRDGQGSGLGLASVYGIVKSHGGFVTVRSKPAEGSSFSVYLPASEEVPVENPARETPPRRGGETVLVVDDEEQIVRVCGRLLERMGHKVLVARSGAEAIEHLRGDPTIALVILDMIMPGMSGRQTYGALRQISPTVKVLLASGYSEEGQAADLLARGCNGFIQKPFDVAKLSAKLREILP